MIPIHYETVGAVLDLWRDTQVIIIKDEALFNRLTWRFLYVYGQVSVRGQRLISNWISTDRIKLMQMGVKFGFFRKPKSLKGYMYCVYPE